MSTLLSCAIFFTGCTRKPAVSLEDELRIPSLVKIGTVESNESKEFEFLIKNNSDAPIKITRIHGTCSCTSLSPEGPFILSNKESKSVTAAVRFGHTSGTYQTVIWVEWTSRAGKLLKSRIDVQGNIVSPLILRQSVIDFGVLSKRDGAKIAKLKVDRGNATFKWSDLGVVAPAGLNVHTTKLSESQWDISVSMDTSKIIDASYADKLTINFTDNNKVLPYEITVPVIAKIRGTLHAVPSSLYLGKVKAGATSTQTVRVTCDSPAPSIVISQSADGVTIDAVKRFTDGLEITIEVKAPDIVGMFTRKVILEESHHGEQLAFNVLGFVAASKLQSKTIP
jgi:hypothetical protein